jgi:hypothetical protein
MSELVVSRPTLTELRSLCFNCGFGKLAKAFASITEIQKMSWFDAKSKSLSGRNQASVSDAELRGRQLSFQQTVALPIPPQRNGGGPYTSAERRRVVAW